MAIIVPPKRVVTLEGKDLTVRTPEMVHSTLDQVKEIAIMDPVVAIALVMVHHDSSMTRAFHIESGWWTQTLGSLEHLKYSISKRYNGDGD